MPTIKKTGPGIFQVSHTTREIWGVDDPPTISKALSVRAPWWWYILHSGKDVENRSWKTNYRGAIYIHASRWWVESQMEDDDILPAHTLQEMKELGGCLVGTVEIVDCIRDSKSKWAEPDCYHFILANPVVIEKPRQVTGKVGFFTV